MRSVVEHAAPAKVNLVLAVGASRDDGMHPIRSWMVTVDLCDELTVTRLEPDCLSLYAILWHHEALSRSEIDWSVRDDLAVRAHLAIETHVGEPLPVKMKLAKRIPVGAGLGGGSSNAAGMLRAVNTLYELGLSTNELADIGASLGADVPFLVHGGSALAEGVGQRLTLHDAMPSLDLVLVMPPVRCDTGAIYARFDDVEFVDRFELVDRVMAEPRPERESLFNDWANPARAVHSELVSAMDAVAELADLPVHLTGSGSGFVILCDDAMHAKALAGAITDRLRLPALAVRPCSVEACSRVEISEPQS